jgi:inhibitor of cysteine peptidase
MKKISLFLMFTLLLGLLAGCSPKESTLTESNNGQPATIKVGGRIVVELESNPSTGFTWEASNLDTSILKQLGETEYKPASSTPMPGQGGAQVLRFEAVAPGTTTLTLIYQRSFETGAPPIKTYTIKVTVEK